MRRSSSDHHHVAGDSAAREAELLAIWSPFKPKDVIGFEFGYLFGRAAVQGLGPNI